MSYGSHSHRIKKLLYATKYWNMYLISEQSYLGRGRLELKAQKPTLSDLSDAEWQDLGVAVRRYEELLKRTFSATMFNWTCMMNNAFGGHAVEPAHVHFHVRPRYKNSVELAGHTFEDPTFGAYYDRSRKEYVDQSLFDAIFNKLAANAG